MEAHRPQRRRRGALSGTQGTVQGCEPSLRRQRFGGKLEQRSTLTGVFTGSFIGSVTGPVTGPVKDPVKDPVKRPSHPPKSPAQRAAARLGEGLFQARHLRAHGIFAGSCRVEDHLDGAVELEDAIAQRVARLDQLTQPQR